MKAGWEVRRLGEVVAVSKTKGGSKPLPYVGLEDISSGGAGDFSGSLTPLSGKSTTFEFGPKHLLYGRLRPYLNKVFRPDFKGHCSSEIFPMLPSTRIDRGYLFHWITSDTIVEKINATSTGARMPRANIKEILTFSILLPPLEEQQRIVAVLDEAFDGLARARAHAEANLQNARELFESFRAEIFESLLITAPIKQLGEISSRVSVGHVGKTSAHYVESGGVIFLRSQNVRPTGIDISNANQITEKFHEALKKSQLMGGEILFVRVGANRGDCCSVPTNLGKMNCANIVFARPIEGDQGFLTHYCQSTVGQEKLLSMTTGSAQGVINTKSVATLLIPMPKESEQRQLAELLDRLRVESSIIIELYKKKIQDIDDLRQSLLQKAFAGELT